MRTKPLQTKNLTRPQAAPRDEAPDRRRRRQPAPARDFSASLARQCFREYCPDLPPPKADCFEIATQFVRDSKPSDPEKVCAVVLLCLDLVRGPSDLLRGGWISLATSHVYAHFGGSGYAAGRTLGVIERFLTWLRQRHAMPEAEFERLLLLVDEARVCCGYQRRRPIPVEEDGLTLRDVELLTLEFQRSTELHPVLRTTAPAAIKCVAKTVATGAGRVRFETLNPDELAPLLWGSHSDGPKDSDAQAKAFLTIVAAFYAWLGERGVIASEAAKRLASQVLRAAQVQCEAAPQVH